MNECIMRRVNRQKNEQILRRIFIIWVTVCIKKKKIKEFSSLIGPSAKGQNGLEKRLRFRAIQIQIGNKNVKI